LLGERERERERQKERQALLLDLMRLVVLHLRYRQQGWRGGEREEAETAEVSLSLSLPHSLPHSLSLSLSLSLLLRGAQVRHLCPLGVPLDVEPSDEAKARERQRRRERKRERERERLRGGRVLGGGRFGERVLLPVDHMQTPPLSASLSLSHSLFVSLPNRVQWFSVLCLLGERERERERGMGVRPACQGET
jgi:hypothetical protein